MGEGDTDEFGAAGAGAGWGGGGRVVLDVIDPANGGAVSWEGGLDVGVAAGEVGVVQGAGGCWGGRTLGLLRCVGGAKGLLRCGGGGKGLLRCVCVCVCACVCVCVCVLTSGVREP